MNCYLCPRKCGVDRSLSKGRCRSLSDMRICRIAPHYYEEPPISGTKGSGTIFFSGCSLDCNFCQNYKISKSYVGKRYTPYELSEEIKKLVDEGVHNINFVSPTHFSDKIKETLDIYRPPIPIVYNTSGYESPEIITGLLEYVDIFLTDLKYLDNKLALQLSSASDYVENCLESLKIMVKSKPIIYGQPSTLLKQGVIIRHLVLPGYLDNTNKIIEYYAENYKGQALFSVMSQFVPMYKSTITRTLKPLEYKLVIKKLIECGITDCFIQELSSATEEFTPEFYVGD